MKGRKEKSIQQEKIKVPFHIKHPKLNTLFGLIILLIAVGIAIFILKVLFRWIGNGITGLINWTKNTLSNVDAVVIVALITGVVSIISVLFSSIVSKIIESKQARRDYLNQKREEPYKQFLDMYYKILMGSKTNEQYDQVDMIKDIQEFSKSLTLWGSNRVVKLWVQFRSKSLNGEASKNIFLLEDLMFAMRKDMGFKRMKKGTLLKFFINDLDEHKGEKR